MSRGAIRLFTESARKFEGEAYEIDKPKILDTPLHLRFQRDEV